MSSFIESLRVALVSRKSLALSINLPPHPSLSPSDGERVAGGRVRGGSWSQCVRKSERRLSINRCAALQNSASPEAKFCEGPKALRVAHRRQIFPFASIRVDSRIEILLRRRIIRRRHE